MLSLEATVPEVLRASAQVLRERGWCQGWYVDGDGSTDVDTGGAVCLFGALNLVFYGTPFPPEEGDQDPRSATLEAALAIVADEGDVAEWNDEPGRTVEEVLAAIETAALITEEDHGEATGDSPGQGTDHPGDHR